MRKVVASPVRGLPGSLLRGHHLLHKVTW